MSELVCAITDENDRVTVEKETVLGEIQTHQAYLDTIVKYEWIRDQSERTLNGATMQSQILIVFR